MARGSRRALPAQALLATSHALCGRTIHHGDRLGALKTFNRLLAEGRLQVPEGYARKIEDLVRTLR